MPSLIKPSFAKGELSPSLYGRVDTAAYQVGLRTARNLIIHPYGGASNRPGKLVVGPVKTHTDGSSPRLYRFRFRTSDQYVLEFGNLYMRVIRNDAHVVNTAIVITAATVANPVVVTAGSHGYSNGDEVFVTGVLGMVQLNGRRFIVQNVAANTMELTDQVTGANINGIDYTAYSSAGTVASVFELVTPYLQADLATLKMVQSADLVTITHPTYAPRDLARTNHNAWTLVVNTYAPGQADPTGVAVAQQGTSGSTVHRYRVTAIRQEEDVFEESLPGLNSTTRTITAATAANPVVITSNSHGYANGDEVEIAGIVGMTEINDRRFFVANQAANTFELEGENGSSHTAYTSGGTANATFVEITDSITVALTILANFNRVTWTAVTGANRYAIYRRESGRYGLIGEVDAPLTTFDDVTSSVTALGAIWKPDLSIGPPRARNPFLLADDFPTASSYYEQRQVYGGSNNNLDTSFYSQTGNRLNMSVSQPVQADDALTATLNAREVHAIRHFVPGSDLIIFTEGGEWRVNAGDNSGFAADTLRQKPQSEYGSGHHRPIVSGSVIIFAEDDDATIRSFGLNSVQADLGVAVIGEKLTLLADHLLAEDGPTEHVITDWDFAHSPDGRLHIVRSDGVMLTMTFDQKNQVIAWTTWDTGGRYEAVIVLKKSISGAEDGIYVVVRRVFGTQVVRYIERVATRKFADVRDTHFLDFGFVLDLPLPITNVTAANPVVVTSVAHGLVDGDDLDIADIIWVATLDANSNAVQPSQLNDRRFTAVNTATNTFELVNSVGKTISGATENDPVVVTSLSHGFLSGDVVFISGVVGMTQINDILFRVANPTTDTFELTNATTGVPINGLAYDAWTAGGTAKPRVDGSAFSAYDTGGDARKVFTTISGLWEAEGEVLDVVADGSEVSFLTTTAQTVLNGDITLPTPASRAHLGFKYISDFELLNVEAASGTIQGALQKIPSVVIRFKKSILPLIGPDKNNLSEMRQRENEEMGSPTTLFTGDVRWTIPPSWNSNGRIFMRQVKPFPMTITAVIPQLQTEDRDDDV